MMSLADVDGGTSDAPIQPIGYDPQLFGSGNGLRIAASVVLSALLFGGVVVAGIVQNGTAISGVPLRALAAVGLPAGFVWEAAQLQRLDVYFHAPVPELVPLVALAVLVMLLAAIVAIWRQIYLAAAGILFVLPVPWIGLNFYALQANPYTLFSGSGIYSGPADWAALSGAIGVVGVMWGFAIVSLVAHSRQRRALGGLSPQAARAIRSTEESPDPMGTTGPQTTLAPSGASFGVAAGSVAATGSMRSVCDPSTSQVQAESIPVVGSSAAVHGDTPTVGSGEKGTAEQDVPWCEASQTRGVVGHVAVMPDEQGVLNSEWTPPTQTGRVPQISGGTPPLRLRQQDPFVGALPLDVEYATFWTRLGARTIDFFFIMVTFVPLLIGTVAAIAAAAGVDPLIAILIALYVDMGLWEFAYYLVGASHGQTIGKRVLGIRVCRDTSGVELGFWKALGRQFASILSTLALFIGWFAPLWTPKRQTWQDSITGTVVVRDRQARLARPAVVWGVVWTLISGAVFGGLAAWGLNALNDAGYEVDYDSSYEAGYYGDDWYNEEPGSDDAATDQPYGYSSGHDDDSIYDETTESGGVTYMPGEWQKALADQCRDGQMTSCDQLYTDTPSGSDIEEVALTCGGVRRRVEPFESCVGWTDLGSGSAFDYQNSTSSSGSLESIAAAMDSDVRALTGSWVVQLSSSTTYADNQAGIALMSESEILDRLNQAESRYSGSSSTPLLLWTGDYNFRFSDMWVVVLDRTYSSHEDALGFCASEGYDRDHCLAKYLDRSSNWDHTSKTLPE